MDSFPFIVPDSVSADFLRAAAYIGEYLACVGRNSNQVDEIDLYGFGDVQSLADDPDDHS